MFRKEPVSGAELSITKSMLLKTFRYIDENFSENLSLRQAAQVSNLSVSHFCRLFKQATGMTFNHYLSFYRVNRSESMLASNQSITEIAYECGFKNLISFIRVFKKLKGCPPSEYRKNILKTIQSVENKQKIPDKLQ